MPLCQGDSNFYCNEISSFAFKNNKKVKKIKKSLLRVITYSILKSYSMGTLNIIFSIVTVARLMSMTPITTPKIATTATCCLVSCLLH